MTLQFIQDKNGNTTGVFIPIEDWLSLKEKYSDLQNEEAQNLNALADWQLNIIDERLSQYYNNKTISLSEFDQLLSKLESKN